MISIASFPSSFLAVYKSVVCCPLGKHFDTIFSQPNPQLFLQGVHNLLACLQAVARDFKGEIQRGEYSVAISDEWKVWDDWQSEEEGGKGTKTRNLPLVS